LQYLHDQILSNQGGLLVSLHNTFFCKYFDNAIMVVLHCKNSYGNTFVIILIVSTHFQ
jgi:hypothetical protein